MGKVQKKKIISVSHVVFFRVLFSGFWATAHSCRRWCMSQRRWLMTEERLALSSEIVPQQWLS